MSTLNSEKRSIEAPPVPIPDPVKPTVTKEDEEKVAKRLNNEIETDPFKPSENLYAA